MKKLTLALVIATLQLSCSKQEEVPPSGGEDVYFSKKLGLYIRGGSEVWDPQKRTWDDAGGGDRGL